MERKKTMATLTALSALLTTGCTVDIDEKKLTEKLGEFGITVRQDGDNVEANIAETTLPIVTTTETTSSVTTSTEKTTYTTALTGTTTYKTTVTSGTTESLKPITMRTHETRGPVPSNSTTTETTTVYTTVVEEQPAENTYKVNNETVSYDCNSGYYVTDKYTVQSVTPCQGKMGEYLYSLVRKIYGSYDEDSYIVKEIKRINKITSNFIPYERELTLPNKLLIYYRANSAIAAQTETELPMDEIKRLNGVDDETKSLGNTYMLVKVLAENEKTFETSKGTAHVCGPAVVIADKFFECGKTYEDGYVTSAIVEESNGDAWLYSVREDGSCHANKLASNVKEIAVIEKDPLILMNEQTVINNVDFAEKGYVYSMPKNDITFFSYKDYGERDGLERKEVIFNQKQKTK